MSAALLLVTRRRYLASYWPALCSVDGVMGPSYGPSLRGRQDSKLFGTGLPIIPWAELCLCTLRMCYIHHCLLRCLCRLSYEREICDSRITKNIYSAHIWDQFNLLLAIIVILTLSHTSRSAIIFDK